MVVAAHHISQADPTFHQHIRSGHCIEHSSKSRSNIMLNHKSQYKRSNSLSGLISFNLDLDEETESSSSSSGKTNDLIDLSAASKQIISDAQLWSDFQQRLRKSKESHANINAQQILVEIIKEHNQASEIATCSQPPKFISTAMHSENISATSELSTAPSNNMKRTEQRRRATMDTFHSTTFSARNSWGSKNKVSEPPQRIENNDNLAACSSASWLSPPSARDVLHKYDASGNIPGLTERLAQLALRTRLSLADEEVS